MKLHEVKMQNTSRTQWDVDDAAHKSSGRMLVSGYYGAVYDRPKDVSGVVKVARAVRNEFHFDGYHAFVQKILNTNNPYFPQLSELKSYQNSSTGEKFFTVRSEKLVPLGSIDNRLFPSIYQRITGKKLPSRRTASPVMAIVDLISDAVDGQTNIVDIVDPQLRSAVRILAQMRRSGYTTDLHYDNVMCRMTPYGPQLVITDPFAGKE